MRNNGVSITVAGAPLPSTAYDTLPERARTLLDRIAEAKSTERWGRLPEPDTDDWHYLGDVLSRTAEADPGRTDIDTLLGAWAGSRPGGAMPNPNVMERSQEHLRIIAANRQD